MEVVPTAFSPELTLYLAQLFEERSRVGPQRGLSPEAVGSRDQIFVRRLARGTELLDEGFALGHGIGQSFPEGSLATGLPYAELEPLELLAGHGVLRQRGGPVLEVEGTQGLQLAPDGNPVS